MPSYTKTWDETLPAGSRSASLGDDDIRDFKYAIRERLATDHKFLADETGVTTIGYHIQVTLIEAAADPTNVANTGILYTKDSGGITELYYIDSAGTIKQLTTNGKLNVTGADLLSSTAQGDLIYYSAASTLARLAKDTNATRYLANTGANNNPQWNQVNLANGVTGTLPIANGGTGATTAQGAINNLAGGVTASRVLRGDGANITLSQVNLTSDVTGTLPVANGGTGYSAGTITRIVTGTYTGDGANTQAITGVGFQGKEVRIADLTNGRDGWKNDQMGTAAMIRGASGASFTGSNHIPSIDADGFTVGDGDAQGNYMNEAGVTYYYTVLG